MRTKILVVLILTGMSGVAWGDEADDFLKSLLDEQTEILNEQTEIKEPKRCRTDDDCPLRWDCHGANPGYTYGTCACMTKEICDGGNSK